MFLYLPKELDILYSFIVRHVHVSCMHVRVQKDAKELRYTLRKKKGAK